ncbi:flagellar basal body-associated FliL family protein [Paracoccus sp. Z118]|uniref:flagellar basal body-associated FliL family protein n=1 Tax=Paracoccus sp. Z118 TaxID=2851017 RepID=UPI001C2BC239|nr:flagellar basal body-associated FliL family protein [Paracoccus sp. Z118]MBV0890759.1 flagellar basal body-associated FliL family protein [Paracoccus sp. Z118]
MADITADTLAAPRRPLLKRLIPVLLPVIALAAGFGTTWTGLWSPASLLHGAPEPPAVAAPEVAFLDVPRIVLTLPGAGGRSLVLTALLDVDPAHLGNAKLLVPRVTDAFTGFLSEIDPAAFDRRGILEIIRAELATRARFVLGEDAVRDLLITEFRIQ